MSSAAVLAGWVLITVTNSGAVHTSETFHTLHTCQEAESLANTGRTIEENKKIQADYSAAVEKWHETHPWREPKTDIEKEVSENAKKGGSVGGTGITVHARADGMVQDNYQFSDGFSLNYESPGSLKYSKCVKEEK